MSLSDLGRAPEDWEERLQALKGKILLRQGQPSEAARLLAPAIAKMQADGLPSPVLNPFLAAQAETRR